MDSNVKKLKEDLSHEKHFNSVEWNKALEHCDLKKTKAVYKTAANLKIAHKK